MKIMGPPTAILSTFATSLTALKPHTRFVEEMVPELWTASLFYGVDPVVTVAQAYKETAAGRYGGKVKPEFHNTCGLKITDEQQKLFPGVTDADNPLAHAQFPNWRTGAIAHVQHLRAYAGVYLPADALILSPRYPLVVSIGNPAPDVEGLSARWAIPGKTYGPEIVALARKLGAAV